MRAVQGVGREDALDGPAVDVFLVERQRWTGGRVESWDGVRFWYTKDGTGRVSVGGAEYRSSDTVCLSSR